MSGASPASIAPFPALFLRETHEPIHGAWFRHPWLTYSRRNKAGNGSSWADRA